MRTILAGLSLLGVATTTNAGTVTLANLFIADYFRAGGGTWQATVIATSTTQWPGWVQDQVKPLGSVDAVVQSGLMLYRESELHRFVWTGPGQFRGKVTLTDRLAGPGLYLRMWRIGGAEDALAAGGCDSGCYPFDPFAQVPEGTPVFAVGDRAVLHLADQDTIAAMLLGDFGPPLAHRASQPCQPLRTFGAQVLSTSCED